MNAGMAHSYESQFGPASDPIDIAQFIRIATELETQAPISVPMFSPSPCSVAGFEAMDQLPEEYKESVAEECSITDIKSSIEEMLDNPTLYAHITKTHDTNVYLIHEHADTSGRRKRKRPALLDPAHEAPAVTALQKTLDSVQLKSWQLMLDSALFMRAPKNSDLNVLTAIKKSVDPSSSSQFEHTSSSRKTALISLTVYNRLSWGHNLLSRSSQHALLASQTLGDLFEAIPCTSNEIPEERMVNGEIVGYETPTAESPETGSSGCVICIEGKAYGDGISENDYADKLIAHFEKFPSSKRDPIAKGPTSIYETLLSSLSLRLNQPYYFLHQGNCEHFVVIDQIRLLHPSDPSPALIPAATPVLVPSSSPPSAAPAAILESTNPYPLTLQITPPLPPLCRACSKVPAIYSIVGDMRLGESPCVLCKVCWRVMGDGDEDVMVVPLPKYELGW
ncbi:hypothetical protein PILCRDRAFT_809875 [Piloderma croceum F 1598]|uniref:snRNA-activating protein complex subunit 3 n=1 Tax=Piloderma croceum (strain F 1598) TaxID=765440 RepID=A0A0C3BZB4_PILCF|nr:hypothetical protein PILCRDRAFT_809875 [Piloderma croceum F 1598]